MNDATNSSRYDAGETLPGGNAGDDAANGDDEVYEVSETDAMFDLENFAATQAIDTATPKPAATHGGNARTGDAKANVSRGTEEAGPVMIELIATRAELRRVEGELEQKGEEAKQAATERQDTLDQHARLKADFDNFRRRAERARSETYGQIAGEVVGKLLPIADNLRRALDTAEAVKANRSPELEQFTDGIELIYKQLGDTLQTYGVAAIPTVGAPFDPNVHEAIALEDSDEFDSNTVIAEIVRGYTLGGKLLRPAMVKVAK